MLNVVILSVVAPFLKPRNCLFRFFFCFDLQNFFIQLKGEQKEIFMQCWHSQNLLR
jgi:hypothetical protein